MFECLLLMGDVDVLTLVIQEMSKTFPSLIETLVNELDIYMSSTLLKVAKEHRLVVAQSSSPAMTGNLLCMIVV